MLFMGHLRYIFGLIVRFQIICIDLFVTHERKNVYDNSIYNTILFAQQLQTQLILHVCEYSLNSHSLAPTHLLKNIFRNANVTFGGKP